MRSAGRGARQAHLQRDLFAPELPESLMLLSAVCKNSSAAMALSWCLTLSQPPRLQQSQQKGVAFPPREQKEKHHVALPPRSFRLKPEQSH